MACFLCGLGDDLDASDDENWLLQVPVPINRPDLDGADGLWAAAADQWAGAACRQAWSAWTVHAAARAAGNRAFARSADHAAIVRVGLMAQAMSCWRGLPQRYVCVY
jgi:hypothetical protein